MTNAEARPQRVTKLSMPVVATGPLAIRRPFGTRGKLSSIAASTSSALNRPKFEALGLDRILETSGVSAESARSAIGSRAGRSGDAEETGRARETSALPWPGGAGL